MAPPKNTPEKIASILLPTFRRVHTWLERDAASRIIVARETTRELRQRELPEHVKIIQKKRRGKRKAVRKRRHYDEALFKLAVWPQDKMDENAMHSFACVTSGEVDFHIADYMLRCSAGDWVIFPAGIAKQDGSEPHFYGDPTGRKGDVLWFICYSGGVSCWLCRSEGKLHSKIENSECRMEHHLLENLFFGFCAEAIENGAPEIIHQTLALILTILAKEIEQDRILRAIGSRYRYEENVRLHDPIAAAIEYIEDNLDHHLTISAVARQVLISPATFTKRFKKQTGKTFVEYQTERRLAVAEQMLVETNISIVDICARVGIKYGQLRLLFHEKYGYSPNKFREQKNKVDINS